MARSQATDKHGYTNPEVRFERTDITSGQVFLCGVVLGLITLISIVAMVWYGSAMHKRDREREASDLPMAAFDQSNFDRWPPEPRLEGLEDIRNKKVRLLPPRAEEYLESQRRLLDQGDAARGVQPIKAAIETLAGRLPARKVEDRGGN